MSDTQRHLNSDLEVVVSIRPQGQNHSSRWLQFKKGGAEAGRSDQVVKSLLCKHEGLRSDPQHRCRSPSMVAHTYNLSSAEMRQGDPWLAGQIAL